ncbi:hypothetical protein MC885_003568 [Smutsia gigantea]|nr:hypothetical protein MC885_003568 [Smutsia gigantea]
MSQDRASNTQGSCCRFPAGGVPGARWLSRIRLLENAMLSLLATDFLQGASWTSLWSVFLIGKTQCGLLSSFLPTTCFFAIN